MMDKYDDLMRSGTRRASLRSRLLNAITAFFALTLPTSADNGGQSKILEVFNSRREINLYLPYEDRVVSFSNMETFQRHYPPDRCELSAFVNDRHKDQLTIKYECPAFYKGQPMQFKFITRMKDSAWVLLHASPFTAPDSPRS